MIGSVRRPRLAGLINGSRVASSRMSPTRIVSVVITAISTSGQASRRAHYRVRLHRNVRDMLSDGTLTDQYKDVPASWIHVAIPLLFILLLAVNHQHLYYVELDTADQRLPRLSVLRTSLVLRGDCW